MNNVFIAIVSESETIGQIMGREELELKRNDSGSGYPGPGCPRFGLFGSVASYYFGFKLFVQVRHELHLRKFNIGCLTSP